MTNEMFSKSRLEIKILGFIIFSLILGFGTLIFWDAERDVKNIIRQHQEKANLMATTIAKSIKNIMYSGNADIVISWLKGLKKVKEIDKLEIIKTDGTEAFRDMETIEEVNKSLRDKVFNRKEKYPIRLLERGNIFLLEVLRTGKKVDYYEEQGGKRLYTQLAPILNDKTCQDCHEYDDHPVRGIIRISTSMEQIDEEILNHRLQAIFISLLAIALSGMLLILLLRRAVVRPINLLKEGVEKVREGNLDYRLRVQTKDVIGQLATSFNEMSENLKKGQIVRERKEFLENIINNVHESIIIFDNEGKILSFSKGSEEIFGFKAEEMVGKVYTDLDFLGLKQRRLLELAEKGEIFKGEVKFKRANGEEFPAYVSVTPLKDEDNKLMGFIKVTRDLTSEKAKDQLQQELIHSEKLAATGQLAANVAHEINTPLASINTCIDGIKDKISKISILEDKFPDYLPKYLDLIKKEVGRCKVTTEKLLLLSRKSGFSPKLVDLNKSVVDTISLIEYEARKNNINVVKALDTCIPLIQADETQIRQLILNIMINGLQAIDHDGILEIITRRVDSYVQLIFKDSGCGIKKEDLDKIFAPFFTLKPTGKGTGLGLSICDKIVKQHKGKILIESQVNKGTQFTVILPIKLE